jgi:hypothetical protein
MHFRICYPVRPDWEVHIKKLWGYTAVSQAVFSFLQEGKNASGLGRLGN